MRIDSPQIVGSLTLDPGSESVLTGSFTGSFAGDGSGLTGVAPIAGAGVTVIGTTVSIGQDVSTTSSVAFNVISASSANFSGDISVSGTASFAYLESITGSAKIIGDSVIILNNNTPAERYAGIVVQDSGSTSDSASFLFDGQVNDWFYEYTDDGGANYEYGAAMFGPEYDTKGSPVYPVSESVLVGDGGHHVSSSILYASNNLVSVHGAVSASDYGIFQSLGVGTGDPGTTGLIRATNDVVAYYSSDKRLKDNITPIENALGKVEAMGGYEFDWNNNQEVYEGHDIGVIAQEVEAILPEIVETRESGYKAVKYEKLTAVLIEAVKELSARVKELESK